MGTRCLNVLNQEYRYDIVKDIRIELPQIHYLEQLREVSRVDIYRRMNVGRKEVRAIETVMAKRDIHFKGEGPE